LPYMQASEGVMVNSETLLQDDKGGTAGAGWGRSAMVAGIVFSRTELMLCSGFVTQCTICNYYNHSSHPDWLTKQCVLLNSSNAKRGVVSFGSGRPWGHRCSCHHATSLCCTRSCRCRLIGEIFVAVACNKILAAVPFFRLRLNIIRLSLIKSLLSDNCLC